MVIKQPNGKYCYFKNTVIKFNLTEEEYVSLRLKETENVIRNELKECRSNTSELIKRCVVSDADLKSMGYQKTYDEMLRYIPKKVIGASYSSRDCETIAHCPSCKRLVVDGMSGTDRVCPDCHQVLEW